MISQNWYCFSGICRVPKRRQVDVDVQVDWDTFGDKRNRFVLLPIIIVTIWLKPTTDFTTLTTVPGTVKVHGAPIQILDLRTSPISGKLFKYTHDLALLQPVLLKVQTMVVEGEDKSLLVRVLDRTEYFMTTVTINSVARTCNLIFIVLDVLKPLGDKKVIESELEGFGIRLNKKPPSILVRKKERGGIAITNTVPLTNIDHDEIKAVLSEYRINNADVAIREPNATADDLVDVVEGNRVYIPALYVSLHAPIMTISLTLILVRCLTKFVLADQTLYL